MFTFKDATMFYHTALRNVGLFTSISLALLGVSHFYQGKGDLLYNMAFVFISIMLLLVAIVLLHKMVTNMNMCMDDLSKDERKVLKEWLIVPEILRYVLYITLGFYVVNFYKQIKL